MKHVLYLYAENVKMLLKEELKKKTKGIVHSRTERLNTVKMSIFPKLIVLTQFLSKS